MELAGYVITFRFQKEYLFLQVIYLILDIGNHLVNL